MINTRLEQDPYVTMRRKGLEEAPKSRSVRFSQSVADFRQPTVINKRLTADAKSKESSLEHSPNKPQNYYEIRDELAKNPKRKNNKVEAYWLDDHQ